MIKRSISTAIIVLLSAIIGFSGVIFTPFMPSEEYKQDMSELYVETLDGMVPASSIKVKRLPETERRAVDTLNIKGLALLRESELFSAIFTENDALYEQSKQKLNSYKEIADKHGLTGASSLIQTLIQPFETATIKEAKEVVTDNKLFGSYTDMMVSSVVMNVTVACDTVALGLLKVFLIELLCTIILTEVLLVLRNKLFQPKQVSWKERYSLDKYKNGDKIPSRLVAAEMLLRGMVNYIVLLDGKTVTKDNLTMDDTSEFALPYGKYKIIFPEEGSVILIAEKAMQK